MVLLCGSLNKLSDNPHKIKGSEINRVDPLVLISPYDLHCHELQRKSLREILEDLKEGWSGFLMTSHTCTFLNSKNHSKYFYNPSLYAKV